MNHSQYCQLVCSVLIALGAVSCGGGSTRQPTPTVLQSIQISPISASVGLCRNQQFTATGIFSDGTSKDLSNSVAWESSVPAIATVSANGLASSQSQGSTTIRAKSDTVSGAINLTVGAPALSSIAVTPSNPSLRTGGTQQFIAMGTCVDGTVWNVTRQVTWTSTSSAAATVTPTGMVTGSAAGGATITATSGNLTASSSLMVKPELASRFLYVSNQGFRGAGLISGYSIDNTSGVLTPIPGLPLSTGGLLDAITVDPMGRFAYIVPNNGPVILGYSIDAATGMLTAIPGSPFRDNPGPIAVAVDPSARFLYVVSADPFTAAGRVSGYNVDSATGALTVIPGSPFAAGFGSGGVAIDPTGRFLYVANGGSHDISAYGINNVTGALTPIPGSPFASLSDGFHAIAFDPAGQFLYVVGRISSGSQDVCNLCIGVHLVNGGSGILTEVAGSPFQFPGPSMLRAITVAPSGRFVYVTNQSSNTPPISSFISEFSVDGATGMLSPVVDSPLSIGPGDIAVDPLEHFTYAVGSMDITTSSGLKTSTPLIQGFSMDSRTGVLSPFPGSPFPAEQGGEAIAIASPR